MAEWVNNEMRISENPNLRPYAGICLQILRKSMKNLKQG
jgi:hypothetical protein